MSPDPGYRYPGAKPFTLEEKSLFQGRRKDIERLFQLLSLKKMIVFYAKSGIGKSSLINAGLIPAFHEKMIEQNFIALPIRFGVQSLEEQDHANAHPDDSFLVKNIITLLQSYTKDFKYPELLFASGEILHSLWYWIKLFEKNNILLLLIFDQSEEIFTYTPTQINAFKEQVYSIFNPGIPAIYHQAIESALEKREIHAGAIMSVKSEDIDSQIDFIYKPLNTKVLFAVREDKLGLFNVFSDYFPDVLKDTFKLFPLSKEGAIDAITLPAEADGNFLSPKFSYAPEALEKLLKNIVEADDTYDSFAIQLNCSFIEKEKVIISRRTLITVDDIPEEGKLVEEFYDSVWKSIPGIDATQIASSKKLLEEKLIDIEHQRRISVHKGAWLDPKITEALIRAGLLKEDTRGDTTYIELSHDRLIKTLVVDYRLRQQEEQNALKLKDAAQSRKKMMIRGIIFLVLISVIYFFIQWKKQNEYTQQASYLFSAGRALQNNPTLSYIIAQDGYKINHSNHALNTLIDSLAQRSNLGYITSQFYCPDHVIAAFFNKGDTITVVSDSTVEYFDKDGLVLNSQKYEGRILHSKYYNGNGCLLVDNKDSVELRSFDHLIERFPKTSRTPLSSDYADLHIAISNNLLLLAFRGSIFRAGSPIPILTLDADLRSIIFTNDSRHIIYGNNDGNISLIDTKGKVIKYLNNNLGSSHIAVTSLAITSDDSQLIAGYSDNSVRIWTVGDLSQVDDNHKIELNSRSFFVSAQLPGTLKWISISPDDKYFITASGNSEIATIWDITGNKIAFLKGNKEPIISLSYSSDGSQIMSCSDTGKIFIWRRELISKLFLEKRLSVFSPFDYKSLGLTGYTVANVYDTTGITNLIKSAINYTASLPVSNDYPDDYDYKKLLDTSIREIEILYTKIFDPKYSNLISPANRKLLYKNYLALHLKKPRLLLESIPQNDSERIIKNIGAYELTQRILLVDTASLTDAILISSKYREIAVQFINPAQLQKGSDSLSKLVNSRKPTMAPQQKKYAEAIRYLKKGEALLASFKKKYPTDKVLLDMLSDFYSRIAFYQFFIKDQKDYADAMRYAKLAFDLDSNNIINYTNLALGYLFNKQFQNAERIYFTYGNNNLPRASKLRKLFCDDFEALSREGILPISDQQLQQEISRIRSTICSAR